MPLDEIQHFLTAVLILCEENAKSSRELLVLDPEIKGLVGVVDFKRFTCSCARAQHCMVLLALVRGGGGARVELGGGHEISLISWVNLIFLTDNPHTTSLEVGFVRPFFARLVSRRSARVRIPSPQVTGE